MRTKALLTVLFVAGAANASSGLARSATASPLLGRWAVDVAQLPMPPAARPRSVAITFRDAGGGRWTTRIDIVDADGSARHSVGTVALDGSAAHVKDGIEADTVALKLPAPNVLVMDLVNHGTPASTRVYTVADDGRTLTETSSYVGDNGLPVMKTYHFTRVAATGEAAG